METVTIERNALRGMLNFAAKKDVRHYINGVLVEATPKKTRLVATDGHVLGVYTHDMPRDVQNTGNVSVILPRELCERITANKYAPMVTLEVDGDNVTLDDCGTRSTMRRIDGTFSNYTTVIPTLGEESPGHFNPELVARFAKFAKSMGVSAQSVRLAQNGKERAAIVTVGCLDFVGVIMPLRVLDAPNLAAIESARSHIFTDAPKPEIVEPEEAAA